MLPPIEKNLVLAQYTDSVSQTLSIYYRSSGSAHSLRTGLAMDRLRLWHIAYDWKYELNNCWLVDI